MLENICWSVQLSSGLSDQPDGSQTKLSRSLGLLSISKMIRIRDDSYKTQMQLFVHLGDYELNWNIYIQNELFVSGVFSKCTIIRLILQEAVLQEV